jgi:hypothetical protein
MSPSSGRRQAPEILLADTELGGNTVVSRVNFLETTPDRIEDVARVVREVVHPGISGEPGYVAYIVLGDRDSGNALGVTLWETDEARTSSDATRTSITSVGSRTTMRSALTLSRYNGCGGRRRDGCGLRERPLPESS